MRKKIVALLLALTMVFGMTAMAFADEPLMTILSASENDIAAAPELITPAPAPTYEGKTIILHTNDVHGAIENYAKVKALKDELEAAGAEVILADAGDYSQGTTYVSTTKGADAVDMMNAVGYDVATLGNHEFDYGYAQLKANLKKANFKVVCADVLENGKTIYDPYTVITMESGLKVAFVGVETPEAQTKTNPALIKGLTFLSTTMFTEVQKQITKAKKEADLVIVLSHLGVDAESEPYTSYDFAKKVTGYDFLIDGHSHTVMTEGPNGEAAQSTGTQIANIGMIVIDNATKKIESNKLVETEGIVGDETVAAAAKLIVDRVKAEYGVKFATSEVTLVGAKSLTDGVYGNRDGETNNGDLITDAMLWTASKDGGITVAKDHIVAITNGGGIRAAIKPGDVTKQDINTVLPFGNTVAVVYVTGAELLEALEASTYSLPKAVGGFPQVSGIEYTVKTYKTYDANAETYPGSTYYGPASINRVTINSINGKEFKLTDKYAVVTNNFCAAGGDTYYAFAAASSQFDTGIPLDEAVMDYVTTELKGVIGEEYAKPQGRINIISYTDLDMTQWYNTAVEYALDNGYSNGKGNVFGPSDVITKAEVLTLLWRMGGEVQANLAMSYEDVEEDQWYTEAVRWALANEMVETESETVFGIAKECAREEVASMVYKYIQKQGGGFTGSWMFLWDKADREDVEGEYMEACMFLDMNKIMQGQTPTTFNPKASITRAEVCKVIYNYLVTYKAAK